MPDETVLNRNRGCGDLLIIGVAVIAIALFVLVLAACGSSPTEPGAEPMTAFTWFDDAYWEMEDCTNVDGDPYRVRWFGVRNYVQVGDSLEVLRDPAFRIEWRRPHDVTLGTSLVDGAVTVLGIDVYEGALRDILQTNDVPQWARDECAIYPIP